MAPYGLASVHLIQTKSPILYSVSSLFDDPRVDRVLGVSTFVAVVDSASDEVVEDVRDRDARC